MKRRVWITEYYSTLNRKGTLTYATIWMELENMKWNRPVTEDLYCIILLSGSGCSCLVTQSFFSNLRTAARQASLSFTISWSLLKLFHGGSDAIQPSHPLSSPSPPIFNLSQHQGLFQWVGSWHQVAKYWSFSFSISPSNEYSGLISFRVDWFDLLAVQGTLGFSPTPQSEAPVLRCSAFYMVQLSHAYKSNGKTIALTRQTFVAKVMSLLLVCCLGLSKLSLQIRTKCLLD